MFPPPRARPARAGQREYQAPHRIRARRPLRARPRPARLPLAPPRAWACGSASSRARFGRLEMTESRFVEAAAAFDAPEVLLGADAGRADARRADATDETGALALARVHAYF